MQEKTVNYDENKYAFNNFHSKCYISDCSIYELQQSCHAFWAK